jgi:hypothetical protein
LYAKRKQRKLLFCLKKNSLWLTILNISETFSMRIARQRTPTRTGISLCECRGSLCSFLVEFAFDLNRFGGQKIDNCFFLVSLFSFFYELEKVLKYFFVFCTFCWFDSRDKYLNFVMQLVAKSSSTTKEICLVNFSWWAWSCRIVLTVFFSFV